MSFKDKFKAFWNSSAGNILALIVGIIALIISVVMISSRTEAAELVEEEELDFPTIEGSVVETKINEFIDTYGIDNVDVYVCVDDGTYRFHIFSGLCDKPYYDDGSLARSITVEYVYSFYADATSWVFASSRGSTSTSTNLRTPICSSFDIYADYNSDEIFFQQTPLSTILFPVPSVVGTVTAPQMSQLMMVEVIGLIPLLVGLVISVVALKKGWKYLKARLKTA